MARKFLQRIRLGRNLRYYTLPRRTISNDPNLMASIDEAFG